ncbi:MAG: sulfocyanin-like copper-binding protein [Actinomycetes bacterium]
MTLTNMGGAMMGGWQGGGTMRILAERHQVPAGTVSFRVANTGSLVHELVVLPLPSGQAVGQRAVGTDNKVDETGALGEASSTCGAGAGDGIDPGGIGWVTLHLGPGTYELLCNLPGHYAAGMYTKLTVS